MSSRLLHLSLIYIDSDTIARRRMDGSQIMLRRHITEVALSQSKINSPVAEQQAIENLLEKRVTRRQGYHSRGPSSSSISTLMSSEISTLWQQLADLLKAQEEMWRRYEDSQEQIQDQTTIQVRMQSRIQLMLSLTIAQIGIYIENGFKCS